MSGEVQADVADDYRTTRQPIEAAVNELLTQVDVGGGLDRWRYLAIIRVEDHPDYDEVAKVLPRGRGVEFRLKIDHRKFTSGSATQKASLVFDSLRRSVSMMPDIGVKDVQIERLKEAMETLGREKGWLPK